MRKTVLDAIIYLIAMKDREMNAINPQLLIDCALLFNICVLYYICSQQSSLIDKILKLMSTHVDSTTNNLQSIKEGLEGLDTVFQVNEEKEENKETRH